MNKKYIGILLAVLLILALPLSIYAAGTQACRITVDPVTGHAGGTITVAVRIGENPGFTNFSIGLEYDPAVLTLQSVETGDENGPYLCGQYAGVYAGQVVAACADTVHGDGILFVATFQVAEGFSGFTRITPKVNYIRSLEASGDTFGEIRATAEAGTATIAVCGDINGDGRVEYDDVMLGCKAFLGKVTLSEAQLAVVDQNHNGIVEETEYLAIYRIYIGG